MHRYGLLLALVAVSAHATKPTPTPPEDPNVEINTSSEAGAYAGAAAAANAESVAGAEAASNAEANGVQNLSAPVTTEVSPSYTNRSTAVGLSMEGPYPLSPVDCYKPAKGYKRGHRILFGAWEVSAIAELDPDCLAEKQRVREWQMQMTRLELQLEQERNRRIELETQYVERQQKGN